MKTLICIILDRSGSMGGREGDTVGGINGLVKEQQQIPGDADITLYRFDDREIEQFRPRSPLSNFTPLAEHEVAARGGTPLLDAVGEATDFTSRVDSEYEKGVLVIVTDGQENSSRKFSRAHIKERLTKMQESGKWGVIYLGADVDAFTEAGAMGIAAAGTAGFTKSTKGMEKMYAAASHSMLNTRQTGSTDYTTNAANVGGLNLGVANLGEDDDTPAFSGLGGASGGAGASGGWTIPTPDSNTDTNSSGGGDSGSSDSSSSE